MRLRQAAIRLGEEFYLGKANSQREVLERVSGPRAASSVYSPSF